MNSKEKWQEKYNQMYPVNEGEAPDYDSDNYYDNLSSMSDEYSRMKSNEDIMNETLRNNPSFYGMMSDMRNGKSFFPSLVRRYGRDALMRAMDDPEIADEIAKSNEEYMAFMQQESERKQENDKNINESVAAINQFAESKGLDEEQINKLSDLLVQIVGNGIKGKFETPIIEAAWKALNYDKDVQEADRIGEVRGRNANIEAKLERGAEAELPPTLGGTMGKTDTPKKEKRQYFNPIYGKMMDFEEE